MTLFNTKSLFGVAGLAALAVIAAAPVSAQTRDSGSVMAYHYDPSGAKVWGAWGPESAVAAPTPGQRHVAPHHARGVAMLPQRKLYLSGRPMTPSYSEQPDRFGISTQR